MATVYILYSETLELYYIGSCKDFEKRLADHLSKKYKLSFTAKTDDWKVFLKIEQLGYKQARNMELHIKRMKSRKYILNLLEYPEIIQKLRQKYV